MSVLIRRESARSSLHAQLESRGHLYTQTWLKLESAPRAYAEHMPELALSYSWVGRRENATPIPEEDATAWLLQLGGGSGFWRFQAEPAPEVQLHPG